MNKLYKCEECKFIKELVACLLQSLPSKVGESSFVKKKENPSTIGPVELPSASSFNLMEGGY